MSVSALLDARAWHSKVSLQVTLPGFGLLVVDRTPTQARALAHQLLMAARDADDGVAAELEAQALEAARKTIDAEAAKTFGSGPAEKRARRLSKQSGCALLTVIDLLAGVGVLATTIGFGLRALTLTA